MNNKEEITPDGFLSLNMMEASDPDGGTDELWVSIESMGYNKGLELVKVCLVFYSIKILHSGIDFGFVVFNLGLWVCVETDNTLGNQL